ncbi:MAG: T9SS type A sorting domain-containing protein, partial [Rubricoccaceae bacterium]|nr:T9SS type A sorting domain-containing protein [Rubricoccaceae bacterium]
RASTSLRFALPAPSDVRLAVFDALGREVALLAEGPHAAGPHAARFDASGLAPGAYVVRLTTADGSEARRLTVTR